MYVLLFLSILGMIFKGNRKCEEDRELVWRGHLGHHFVFFNIMGYGIFTMYQVLC